MRFKRSAFTSMNQDRIRINTLLSPSVICTRFEIGDRDIHNAHQADQPRVLWYHVKIKGVFANRAGQLCGPSGGSLHPQHGQTWAAAVRRKRALQSCELWSPFKIHTAQTRHSSLRQAQRCGLTKPAIGCRRFWRQVSGGTVTQPDHGHTASH